MNKLGRDWSIFLFLSGYEVDVLTPKKTPKSMKNTPRKNKESGVEPSVGHEIEMQLITEPMEPEIEKIQETMAPKQTSTSS